MDGNVKCCRDYSAVGIRRGTCYEDGKSLHYVERDGRRLFSTRSSSEAAMFAEELYERITNARTSVGRLHKIESAARNFLDALDGPSGNLKELASAQVELSRSVESG